MALIQKSGVVATLGEFGEWEDASGGEWSAEVGSYRPAARPLLKLIGPPSVSDLTLVRAFDPVRDQPVIGWVAKYLVGQETPRPCTIQYRVSGRVVSDRTLGRCKPHTVKHPEGKAGDGALAQIVLVLAIGGDDDGRSATPPTQLKVEAGPSPYDYTFQFNPESVDYDRSAHLADVPIALDEAGRSSAGLATQWTRNQPERIHVEFLLYVEDEFDDVEADLNQFDRLMDKDRRTGEPPTLLFLHAGRTDRVKIESKSVKQQKKFSRATGKCQHAKVTLVLKVLTQRL